MAANSKIEWTDHTFNPWRGCEHAALADGSPHPGCEHCYAESMSKRNPGTLGEWGPVGKRVCAADAYWQQPLKWNAAAEASGVRNRVFCASLADVFEDWKGPIAYHKGGYLFRSTDGWIVLNIPFGQRSVTMDDLRCRLFELIDDTPNLDWLLLTKRPENIGRMWCSHRNTDGRPPSMLRRENVWLGTSVSDQRTADELLPHLVHCRNLVPTLFVSAEPLLSEVLLQHDELRDGVVRNWLGEGGIDWMIVGGESGPHARPMHPDWARSLRDQCQAAGVAFFFKQWGEWAPAARHSQPAVNMAFGPREFETLGQVDMAAHRGEFATWTTFGGTAGHIDEGRKWAWTYDGNPNARFDWHHQVMARVGKHAAGRLLDGRTWDEMPEVAHAGV